MSTNVIYNTIEMHSVQTKRWDQEIVRDSSDTDNLYCKYTMEFEGLVHVQGQNHILTVPVWTASSNTGYSRPIMSELYPQITQALQQSRGQLSVTMGGQTMFRCDPCTELDSVFHDVDNGPKPRNITITHVTAPKGISPVLRVSFTIECARVLVQDSGNAEIPDLVNNRWSITETLDSEYFTVRSIHGKIRVSNPAHRQILKNIDRDSIQTDAPLEYWRGMIVPVLENGFKRDRIDFNPSANGLEVDYVVTDKQVHTAAPWPAVKLNVTHVERTADGAAFESNLHIVLHGHPATSKVHMFSLAERIIEDRLGSILRFNQGGPVNSVITSLIFIDHINEQNVIEVDVVMTHTAKLVDGAAAGGEDAARKMWGWDVKRLGQPLEIDLMTGEDFGTSDKKYDSRISPAPEPWGYDSEVGWDFSHDGNRGRMPAVDLLLAFFLQKPEDISTSKFPYNNLEG